MSPPNSLSVHRVSAPFRASTEYTSEVERAFAMLNPTQFHRADGSGYEFLSRIVLQLDGPNPQLASRLATAFGAWRLMSESRRSRAEAALRHIAEKGSLSRDVADIDQRSHR